MNDHIRSVFIFAFTARTRGLIDTDEKQNMCRLLVEIWGKANWDKRWQGSIFNELASKCARNGPRHSIIESITWTAYSCAFKGCFCLRERNSNTFPYHTSFSSLRMYRNFFFANIKSWELEIAFSNHKAALKIMKKLQGQSFTIVVLMDFLKKYRQWLWFRGQFLSDMEYMFS